MKILEHGQTQEKTLLFLPCTAEPVWAFTATVELLSQKWHVFKVVYDGHQPEYPGDFTSVEQMVDEITAYLKERGVSRLDAAYGCSLGGACLTRMLALVIIEGSHAKFTWGVKNGTALAALLPDFRLAAEHGLTEGMAVLVPIYKVLDKLTVVRNISNKIIVMEKR